MMRPSDVNIYEYLTQLLRYRPRDPHKIFAKISEDSEVSENKSTESYLFVKEQLAILSV